LSNELVFFELEAISKKVRNVIAGQQLSA
jgi:ribosomal protein S17E